jgi:hypothetical protein
MATISANHQLPMDGAASRVDAGHATVLGDQTGNAQTGANVGTRRSSGVDEQRIKRDAPNAQAGLKVVGFIEHRLDADDIVDDHRQLIERDRPGRQDRIQDAELVQHLYAAGLNQMSRRRLRRKLSTVNQADAQTPPREHHRQWGTGTPRTDDHDIESLHAAPAIARRLN